METKSDLGKTSADEVILKEQPAAGIKEVESINGYYKKVVFGDDSDSYEPAGKPRLLAGLSQKVFHDRYALKNEKGEATEKTAEEMWRRVAGAISQAEKSQAKQTEWAKKFYWALEDFKFVPAGRILTGAGSRVDLTYYNCFVLPYPEDSRGGIMDSVKTMVEILSRGGGVGVNLSSLRPRGSYVKGVNGTASGAVSFGGLYSFATGLVIQGGSRRGALMLMLNDHHPDVEEFITVKRTMGQVTNANLSVCVSDKFMAAVKNDADWDLHWGGKIYKTVKANALWDLITESAWASGEPGCVFMERCQKQSNTWYFEDIISVNPCGEQPLPAWGVCNLGAVNLASFAKEGKIDWRSLGRTTSVAVRFLDNVIDSTPYFFDGNKISQSQTRRIGLGTMGLADMFIKLGIRYGGEESLRTAEQVYRFMRDQIYLTAVEIAAEKGAFPQFDKEKYLQGEFIKQLPEQIQDAIAQHGIRNAVLQTQAPTGTTSILAGVSSGIEPVFDFAFVRKDRLGEHIVYHPLYQEYKEAHPGEPMPDYFVNSMQLTPLEHVRMQAVAQKYTDASISKTVNAPEEHAHADVKVLYQQAYELGCKGVTYFRENSRDVAVLQSLAKKEKQASPTAAPAETSIRPKERPEVMAGKTYKTKTAYGTLYVTVNNGESGAPFEIFATIGKAGGFFAAKSEAICRLASLALSSGIAVEEVIKQLKGIRGPMPSFGPKGAKILSLADAIAQILERHIKGEQVKIEFKTGLSAPSADMANHGHAPDCPQCGGILEAAEGCQLCRSCGFSKCG